MILRTLIKMIKKIGLYTLLLILTITSCNNINEEDVIGAYAENHKCFKDSIWLLPDGRFLQRIYNRKGTLIYEEESRWHLYPDRLRIDCISALPEREDIDTISPLALEGGGADLLFYREKDTFAIYIPVYHELEIGFYFYKVESGEKISEKIGRTGN